MKKNKTGISMKSLLLLALLPLGFVSCKDDELHNEPAPVAVDYHQTARTQFVEAGGAKYAYRVLGDGDGIPLVLLSPLGSALDGWDPAVTNGLTQYGKVIIFDNKGVGASTGKTPQTIADMAKDAVTFIRALGYSKVDLMGFSMGSFISQQIALTEPSLVNKMILTGTGPKGAEGLSNLTNLLAAAAGLSPEEQFLQFGFTKSAESRDAGKQSYNRQQQRMEDRDPEVSEESAGAQVAAVLGWAQPDGGALKELETITQPVLIVQGQEDVPVPVINAINMSQHIPSARLVLYPDAAHAALFQHAKEFVHEAGAFLRR